MKKILIIAVALCTSLLCTFAETNASMSDVECEMSGETSTTVYYDGNAYSAAQDGLIPTSDGSVSVYWTSDGCSVNGKSGYQPYRISGGTFTMRVNGKCKDMTHYISYQGDRYFFQI